LSYPTWFCCFIVVIAAGDLRLLFPCRSSPIQKSGVPPKSKPLPHYLTEEEKECGLGLQVAGEVFRQIIKDNNGCEQDQANKGDLIDAFFYERI